MADYEDIEDEDYLDDILASLLKQALKNAGFELVFLFEDNDFLGNANELIKENFLITFLNKVVGHKKNDAFFTEKKCKVTKEPSSKIIFNP